MNILVAWIGNTDIEASKGIERAGIGPIARAFDERNFDRAILIDDCILAEVSDIAGYFKWIKKRTKAVIEHIKERLEDPTNYESIYNACVKVVNRILKENGPSTKLTFHISPGTPAMQTVWVILAKTRFQAELIQSSKAGVRTVSIPFDISAEFIPDLVRQTDKELERLTIGGPTGKENFGSIIHRSLNIGKLIKIAERAAISSYSVLIEGESGTGKELFATAIHNASPRREKPLVTVNCGAIPSELVEAELFGYKRGSFTNAQKDRAGYFEAADGGTIFLDEIGELPLSAQVKLLRVLQEKEVTRIGENRPRKIDVRVISATNRNLIREVAAGNFREDLYFRLAVLILQVPPLRERQGDLSLLIKNLFEQIKKESPPELRFEHKVLSPSAKNLLQNHHWPGNVRELQSVLVKAAFWSTGDKIEVEDVRQALSQGLEPKNEGVLNLQLGNGFKLEDILNQVVRHYLKRALEETHGNKTKAAELVGLPSYQTFTNWWKEYKVDGGT